MDHFATRETLNLKNVARTASIRRVHGMRATRWVMGLLMSAFLVATLFAQESAVPINIQVVLFKKIFMFDKSLQGDPKIVVVYADASQGSKDDIVSAFQQAGLTAFAVKSDQAAARIPEASVVYLAAGAGSAKSLCVRNSLLSISGVTSLVEEGAVAVGIGTESGKPKIVVTLGVLKSEGHELSADVLKMARIIQ